MVAVASAAVPKNPSVVTRPRDPTPNSSRRPLTPSEKDNAGVSRRPLIKEITSRYLSSYSSSSSSTTSTSYASNTTLSSSSSFASRRFPSPLPAIHRPSTPSTFFQGGAKRSQSVDRPRPSSPRSDPRRGGSAVVAAGLNASRALCTTTRSLSVSFQGESFFYQTSQAKDASPVPARKPSPDRRRPSTPVKNSNAGTIDNSENSKPRDHHHRWPAAKSRQSNLLNKSLDSSVERNDLLFTVQLLRQSMLFDGSRRTSFDAADFSASSDTDSFSSESNSGTPELSVPQHALSTSSGISVPGRFRQEAKGRLHRLPESRTPLSSSGLRNSATQNVAYAKKSPVNNPFSSPRPSSSLLRGPVRPSSPSKLAGSSPRGLTKPSQARGSSTMASSSPSGLIANAPSIISFAAEMRRSRKGENRIEEAHTLRLLHNRHLQWRCVNARTNAALMIQRVSTEKSLYNAWIQISKALDLVAIQKIKLHFLMQHQKLTTILKGQMVHLEEWSLLDREHSSSLSGAIGALKASTLRLPVVNGSWVDLQEVKDAVWSAIVVMETMGASMHSLISKVEGVNSLVSEMAHVAALEQALLNQSRKLLSRVAALNVKNCSLRGHLLQLKGRTSGI
ncbi:hypothetical protein KSP40_PGU019456 [Platanthera guangdongensis]|uniref:QWRF motif-containing protein 2 n=1 Tax=Platanthera guangdongensis TaxID=2320717 RepID=A0ABR2M6S0_9ASPA